MKNICSIREGDESQQIGVQELNSLTLALQHVLTLTDRRIPKIEKMYYSYNLMRTQFWG